jgi:hypothetical protein
MIYKPLENYRPDSLLNLPNRSNQNPVSFYIRARASAYMENGFEGSEGSELGRLGLAVFVANEDDDGIGEMNVSIPAMNP